MFRSASIVLVPVLALAACQPSRGENYVRGTLEGTREGAPYAVTFDFGILQAGSVLPLEAGQVDLSKTGLAPFAWTTTAGAATEKTPALGIDQLPPSLAWAGTFVTAENPIVRPAVAFDEETQWLPGGPTPATFIFDEAELTEDPAVPLVVRGRVTGSLAAGEDVLTFADTTFQLSADCRPDAPETSPRLCGDAPVFGATWLGFVNELECPEALTRRWTGGTTAVVFDDAKPEAATVSIGGAPEKLPCRRVTTKDGDPQRYLCAATFEDLVAEDGCTWRGILVTEPQARTISLSAWANEGCATPVCNVYR